jgi:hypothetical protein
LLGLTSANQKDNSSAYCNGGLHCRLSLFFLLSLSSQVIHLKEKVTHKKFVLVSTVSRNTMKAHLRKLSQSGQINQHGAGRGV